MKYIRHVLSFHFIDKETCLGFLNDVQKDSQEGESWACYDSQTIIFS